MIKSIDINSFIQAKILNGRKVPHSTSDIVIYKEDERYYLAAFVFFYNKSDIENGAVDRPTLWAIADIETGEIIEERDTKKIEFSDASYDKKYNVCMDDQYDTSKNYYDIAFAKLDNVRSKLIEIGELDIATYQEYLDMIIVNIPKDYQRFFRDLSI